MKYIECFYLNSFLNVLFQFCQKCTHIMALVFFQCLILQCQCHLKKMLRHPSSTKFFFLWIKYIYYQIRWTICGNNWFGPYTLSLRITNIWCHTLNLNLNFKYKFLNHIFYSVLPLLFKKKFHSPDIPHYYFFFPFIHHLTSNIWSLFFAQLKACASDDWCIMAQMR